MTATAPASEPIINHADALAPDWDAVPFDVACARCGHNLRGLSKPQCPACDLTFDWSEAIPLEKLVCGECGYHLCGLTETRCPECGTQFTWEDALAEYHRRKKLVFEYRWRDQPVRSLLGTWCLAARPKRLWSTLDLHDPPQIRPLLGQVFIGFILFGAVLVPVMGLGEWLRARWYLRLGLGTWGRQTNGNVSDLPGFIWDALSDWQTSSIVETTGLWLLCSFLALLVFQQSMRRCKVRTAHVVRVWAYALPLMLAPFVGLAFLLGYVLSLASYSCFRPLDPDVLWLFLVVVVYALSRGYKLYLRMPHAWAVAVASQLMAVLATATIQEVT